MVAWLAEKPSHGDALLKALGERSGGFYGPSPGMVSPALTAREESGHATVELVGTKKLSRLTEEGRRSLERHRLIADGIGSTLACISGTMERVRRVCAGEAAPGGGEEDDAFDLRGAC